MRVVEVVGQMLSTIVAREQVAQAHSAAAAAAYALAERDQLTGLYNRRGWMTALEHGETRCRRYGAAADVLVLDLDELKLVNDTGGHAAGDELIALCAEVLRVTSRPGDTVARTGGDEFAVLGVECDAVSLRASSSGYGCSSGRQASVPRQAVQPAVSVRTSPRLGSGRTPPCSTTSAAADDAGA